MAARSWPRREQQDAAARLFAQGRPPPAGVADAPRRSEKPSTPIDFVDAHQRFIEVTQRLECPAGRLR
jgi:hypothetical protein